VQCNVACAGDVAALAATMAAAGAGPVRAVLHVGGTLQDATLPAQSSITMRAVFAPKLQVWR
jgi:KR domain